MTVTVVLAIILFVLMFVVGGSKGIGAFISLWINFILMFAMLMLINFGFNAMIVLLVGSALVLLVTILSASADEETTTIALVASIIVMLLLAALIIPVEHLNFAQGFTEENSEELEGLTLGIGLNFVTLGIVAALMATLGAIAEAAIAVTAGTRELLEHQPDMSIQTLSRAGTKLGQQIVGTAVNTVLFGFMADFLSLGIWFAKLNYSLGDIINSKLFVSAMLSMLYAFLGVILVLPVSIALIIWQQRKSMRTRQTKVETSKS
ncbi:MAG: YibE/F family protein [Lactobacillaceae bacterium]|jgi:uncharacterized membrane protein|nr:YibE/F family protein [Lactobacillaceae bacterium]